MRVGYAGLDFLGSCLTAVRQRSDYELALLITPDETNPQAFMLRELGKRSGVPVLSGQPDSEWVEVVNGAGLDVLIVAAYRWKIPIDRLRIPYAMNVHPSLLPLGRGPNPLPHLLLESPSAAGVTIHELAPDFDSGPILVQEAIEVGQKDVTDIYLEVLARSARLIDSILDDPRAAFAQKKPQSASASWLPEISWQERTFDAATITVSEIESLSRVHGLFGLSALFPDGSRQEVVLRRALLFDHGLPGGKFVQWGRTRGVLRIADGYALVSMSALI